MQELSLNPPAEEPLPDPNRPPWGAGTGLGVWMFSVAAVILVPTFAVFGLIVYEQISGGTIPTEPTALAEWLQSPVSVLVQVLSLVVAHLLTIGVCWAVVTRLGSRPFWETLGWKWEGSRLYKTFFVILTVMATLLVLGALTKLLPNSQNTMFDQLLKTSSQVRWAIAFMAVFTAPIVEEAVYRGVLFSALIGRIGLVASIFIVTFLFAVVHFPQYWGAWSSMAGLTFLSFLLTYIRARTKSILPCIAIHTIFNTWGAVTILLTHGQS